MAARVVRLSLVDQVAEAIVELIAERGLQEGDPLPGSPELEKEFGVSRTVVREAISELAGRGVVIRGSHREAVVATPGTEQIRRLVQFRVQHTDITLEDLLDLREVLEP